MSLLVNLLSHHISYLMILIRRTPEGVTSCRYIIKQIFNSYLGTLVSSTELYLWRSTSTRRQKLTITIRSSAKQHTYMYSFALLDRNYIYTYLYAHLESAVLVVMVT